MTYTSSIERIVRQLVQAAVAINNKVSDRDIEFSVYGERGIFFTHKELIDLRDAIKPFLGGRYE